MDSSIPGAVFNWTVYNYNSDDRHISITFTFQSGSGLHSHKANTVSTKTFQETSGLIVVNGVIIEQKINDYPHSYGIATKKQANGSSSYFLYFNPNDSGNDIWKTLKANGELNQFTSTNVSKSDNEEMACAVCYRSCVSSNSSSDYIFSLTWDMPKFSFSTQALKRFYTKYFGENGDAVPQLSSYCISNYSRWEKEIYNWQKPVLENKSLPNWYKSALFNELYYISDGGTVWTLIDNNEELPQHDPRIEYGRFGYLEGHEYRMYNTYDVHFYASCSLISLWPKLQLSVQYDICDAIEKEDKTRTWFLYNGEHGYRKVKDTVPHDLGDPDENPFILINSYQIHDVSTWRDLNLKYVLQVYRDYVLTKDVQYVVDMFPQVVIVMKHSMTWDSDNDGMIENSGYPDQTYDAWVMSGTSAYCGSLWLAALNVTITMANMIGEHDIANELSDTLTKGKHSFEKKLWNGVYYNFDSSGGAHSTSIMADQLCGLWWLHCCNIEQNVFNPTYVQQSLQYIYEKNVCCYFGGSQGAVNGMFPDGKIDRSAVQSEEVWTGVTYALASLLIYEGFIEQGFKTAEGLYDTVYNKSGLAFATPEALYETNSFRAISYMRALSVWSMQMAIESTK
nr:non-lysosomal glucosylceramidase isoform X1 [Halyomorpha halys]